MAFDTRRMTLGSQVKTENIEEESATVKIRCNFNDLCIENSTFPQCFVKVTTNGISFI